MRRFHDAVLIVLLALVGAGIVALVLTRSSASKPANRAQARAEMLEKIVDQRPLETATRVAALASGPEEQRLAQDAERAADHEVDLAFTDALRLASEGQSPSTGEARAIQARIEKAEAAVKSTQDRLSQLKTESTRAKGVKAKNLLEQTELTQAELVLDQDELADAQQDLSRMGGDAYDIVERLWKQHEAFYHSAGAQPAHPSTASSLNIPVGRSLVAQWGEWSSLRSDRQQLEVAQQAGSEKAATLTHYHDKLEQQVRDERSRRQTLMAQAESLFKAAKPSDTASAKTAAAAALSLTQTLSNDEKTLADLDQRIQDLRQLAADYGQWITLAGTREHAALHRLIRSGFWIVLTLLIVFLLVRLIHTLFARSRLERKQKMTLSSILRFTVEALGVLAILLVLFGSPSQFATVLGLVGAGLAVALKDFVLAFCGWFVLMGSHGIRVGEWVEINGVRGEVLEVGLLRTVLLETGNWNEPGHPTGRQVAFLNSFAVEGYYFNFSTAGQWLWDELQVLIPAGENPYPLVEQIRAVVEKETAGDAQLAEQDWQQVRRRYGVKSFPATPVVTVRPSDAGVHAVLRYITRANERYEVRSRLSLEVVKLLHHGERIVAPVPPLPAPEAAAAPPCGPKPLGDGSAAGPPEQTEEAAPSKPSGASFVRK
jgi:small-conductance mechanosensitive channel